jgi:hypothetical protein
VHDVQQKDVITLACSSGTCCLAYLASSTISGDISCLSKLLVRLTNNVAAAYTKLWLGFCKKKESYFKWIFFYLSQ